MADDARARITAEQQERSATQQAALAQFGLLTAQLDALLAECREGLIELRVAPTDLQPAEKKAKRRLFQPSPKPVMGWWFWINIGHVIDERNDFVVWVFQDGSWRWADQTPLRAIAYRIEHGIVPLCEEGDTRLYLSEQVTHWAKSGRPF